MSFRVCWVLDGIIGFVLGERVMLKDAITEDPAVLYAHQRVFMN